jgi:tetratricopeptide (TPR) repeat protein/class 3 adenylate cyclase
MAEPIRKLATIVFTDIVGFTKLTAKDQQKASDLLDIQRAEFKPLVESYQGKWIKEVGDGLILTFDTINKAVHCCIKIQEKAKTIENLSLRIGIHLGEILEKENDIIGDDVNITARIEPFSAPGGIAISNKVNDGIVRESEFTTKYLGKPKLKGVAQKVEVYCITSHGLPETKLSDVSAKLEKSPLFIYSAIAATIIIPLFVYLFMFQKESVDSIAVLYMDVGNNSELNYLETITEDLIFDLISSTQGLLNVSESGAVKKYKNSELSLEDLADDIGVDYIFQSSVQPDANGYHFRCRLFDSNKGKDRFINKWFIESKNLQSIVSVLVDNIVKELDIETSDAFTRIEYNSEAYDLYLKSKSVYSLSDNYDDNLEAVELMKQAISKDNNLVMAQIYLGQMQYDLGYYAEASIIYEKALSRSKSLQDNAGVAESLRKQGQLLRKNKDYEAALAKFGEALSISTVMNDKSSMAKTYNSMAILNYRTDDKDNALKNWLHALAIVEEFGDKPKISKYLNNIGIWYWKDDDYSKSIEYYQKSLLIKRELGDVRNIGKTLNNLGEVYFAMGDYTNSTKQFDESIKIKEKLKDDKGLNTALYNRGETYFYSFEYNRAIDDFRRTIKMIDDEGSDHERYRYIGMSHFYLSNFDSCNFYLKKSDEFFANDFRKRLSILPYLVISYMKTGDNTLSNTALKNFRDIIADNDPPDKDYIITNWAAYKALSAVNEKSEAAEYLENAYFMLKSKSKDIKNKQDRKKYLSAKLHENITNEWSKR